MFWYFLNIIANSMPICFTQIQMFLSIQIPKTQVIFEVNSFKYILELLAIFRHHLQLGLAELNKKYQNLIKITSNFTYVIPF